MSIEQQTVREFPGRKIAWRHGSATGRGELAVRIDAANPDHHLWNNNGTWFIHYTVYPDALTKERVRQSLGTRRREEARRRRDELLETLAR